MKWHEFTLLLLLQYVKKVQISNMQKEGFWPVDFSHLQVEMSTIHVLTSLLPPLGIIMFDV